MTKQVQNFKATEQTMTWNAGPAREFTHKAIDRSMDKGMNLSNAASKISARGLIPELVDYAMSMLALLGVPVAVRKPLGEFFSKKSVDLLDPAVEACVTSTSNVARTSLHKSTDTCWSISDFFHSRVFPWFRQ